MRVSGVKRVKREICDDGENAWQKYYVNKMAGDNLRQTAFAGFPKRGKVAENWRKYWGLHRVEKGVESVDNSL